MASSAEPFLEASFCETLNLGRRVPSKPDPIFEAGENGVLLTADTLGTSTYGINLRGLHGFFATKASAFAKATCGTSYGGTGSDTMKIRRRLTQIDADLFLAGLVSSASSALKASFRHRDSLSVTGPFAMAHL